MRILFQGDSITDAGRDRNNIHDLGHGYAKYVATLLSCMNIGQDLEFINLGISGDRAECLKARWITDCIDLQPDVLSILIGINDTWHRAENKNWMPHEYFESCYEDILRMVKEKTNAKIIIMEQFQLAVPDKEFFRVDLDPKIQIVRRLARKYADSFIPLDGLFAQASVGRSPEYWANDGVHPTAEGCKLIAKYYVDAILPFVKK